MSYWNRIDNQGRANRRTNRYLMRGWTNSQEEEQCEECSQNNNSEPEPENTQAEDNNDYDYGGGDDPDPTPPDRPFSGPDYRPNDRCRRHRLGRATSADTLIPAHYRRKPL